MNVLLIGRDSRPLLPHIPNDNFLLIDDGPVADEVLGSSRTVRTFDPLKDSFDCLRDMDDRKARTLWDVLKGIFPEGESTLTKATAEYQILSALLDQPEALSTLVPDTKDTRYAYQLIQKLLMSDIIRNVLEPVSKGKSEFSFQGTIVARLDRAQHGEFACFVLGNFLISQYAGTIIVPDFGFYAIPSHQQLIRQNRLIAGINSFDELPAFKNRFLQFDEKIGSVCTLADAELLATYAGILPDREVWHAFIDKCIRPRPA